jgi:hypothetical protein
VHHVEEVVDGRWGQAFSGGGVELHIDIVGGRMRQILIKARLPWRGNEHTEVLDSIDCGLDRGRGILPRLQVLKVAYYQILAALR